MAFTVEDFHDLVRLLHEHPEWRQELRRLVLADEMLDLPRVIQELSLEVRQLVAAQASTDRRLEVLAGRVEALTERVNELTDRLDRLTERVHELTDRLDRLAERVNKLADQVDKLSERLDQLAERVDRLTDRVDKLAEAQEATERRLEELARAQAVTERRLAELAERTKGLERRFDTEVAELKGSNLELTYRARAAAYFGPLLKGLQVLSDEQLVGLLDKAVDDGRLTWEERNEVLRADLVVRGRPPKSQGEVHLVVEVSWGVGKTDVERAAARAALLAKIVPDARPVVGGHSITPAARQLAEQLKVVTVTDGKGPRRL